MSTEPKRVELTEAEHVALVDAVGYHCSHTGPIDMSLPYGCRDCDDEVRTSIAGTVALIVAAREAAARREALLEVESRLQPPPPWPASDKKVANDRGYAAGWCDALAVVEELRTEESA